MNKKFKICDAYVHPSESANLAFPLPPKPYPLPKKDALSLRTPLDTFLSRLCSRYFCIDACISLIKSSMQEAPSLRALSNMQFAAI